MQHSYEALDRPGGVGGAGLLSPLRHRDFRVLWAGMAVSLLGDGIFLIAVAWEAYSLWNAPAALALVGIGMTVPTILFLVPGGVVSDRLDRRAVMFTADAVRATAVAVLALLALTGSLRFWELVAVVAVYGAASAFFMPAFDAVVPIFSRRPIWPPRTRSTSSCGRSLSASRGRRWAGCSCPWGRALRSRSTQPRSRSRAWLF